MATALYLAFDYGTRRIGIAIGSAATGRARALPTLHHKDSPDWPAITALVKEWQPDACVVGLPLDEDGSEQALSEAARAFATRLGTLAQLPVHLSDERFSSRAADDVIRHARAEGHMARRARKGQRDGIAACLILEQFFASQAAPPG